MPQSVPPDLVFFVFHQLGNFNRQNHGFWRKASGPEHKLLRDPATCAVSLQAAFQSELICKQMQGLLLRPVDCSESLSLRLFGIGGTVSLCRRPGTIRRENGQKLPPRLLPAQNDDQIFLWRVLLFVMIFGNVTSHIVLSITVRVTKSVMFFHGGLYPGAVSSYRIGSVP